MGRIKPVDNLLDRGLHGVLDFLLVGMDHSLVLLTSVAGRFNAQGRKHLKVEFLAQQMFKLSCSHEIDGVSAKNGTVRGMGLVALGGAETFGLGICAAS